MSRVQLALNVSDLEKAVGFYSKLFDAEPAKRRPGVRELRHRRAARSSWSSSRATAQPGTLNHLGVEVESPTRWRGDGSPGGRGHGHRDRGRGGLLLRGAGQGVGRRPRRGAVGDLHRARRRRAPRRRAPRGRARRRTRCAAGRPRSPLLAAAEWARSRREAGTAGFPRGSGGWSRGWPSRRPSRGASSTTRSRCCSSRCRTIWAGRAAPWSAGSRPPSCSPGWPPRWWAGCSTPR